MSIQGCSSMTSLVFVPKRLVADGQARDSHNDPHVRESNGNQGVYWNALVFLSARVLSHCGFLLSLFAVWMAWLMPTALLQQSALPDIKRLKSRTKPHQHLSSTLPSILATNAASAQQARRVYFEDEAPHILITKQAVSPAQTAVVLSSQSSEARLQLRSSDFSSENVAGTSESLDSLVFDSDSSSRPSSLKRSSRLAKFKLGFRSSSLDVTVNQTSGSNDEATTPRTPTFTPKGNRASLPIQKAAKRSPSRFSFRRCSLPESQTPKPTPRTMPYGPPYFATPPMLLDDHRSTYLNTRSQLKDELRNSRTPGSDSELARGRTIRRVPLCSTSDNERPMSGSTS